MLYYVTDGLGSTLMTLKSSGEIVDQSLYQPFGAELFRSGPYKNYRYGGGFQTKSGGQEYYTFGYRAYDPWVGRFLARDPLIADASNPQTLNRYSYVFNSPTNGIDPTGLMPEQSCSPNETCGPTQQELVFLLFLRSLPDFFDLFNSGGSIEAPAPPPDQVGNVSEPPGDSQQVDGNGIESLIAGATVIALGEPGPFVELGFGLGAGIAIVSGSITGQQLGDALSTVFQQDNNETVPPDAESAEEFTDKVGKIAKETEKTVKEVKKAIERIKQEGLPRDTNIRNPDVKVNPKTGEVRPKNPDGSLGDPIGNIRDFF